MFKRILIANRGEIAVRIIRACRELGISPVAVYSEADAGALHVRLADLALPIGPAPAAQSYLRGETIIAAAQAAGAEAIHPGYGFLSENAGFAQQCRAAGIAFIGPPPEAIRAMGGKIGARAIAVAAGVPVVPGYDGADQRDEALAAEAARIGFPLLIKASAGGGGKGMRAVYGPDEFVAALEGARREARAAFGDATVFLERLILRPRHVEIQVLADAHGAIVHLGERECSIQRRHQKILEEAPSPALSPALRAAMGDAAVRAARAAGYVNAGTVEFVLDPEGRYYFLEMNTRLQVEHPVTELVTGLDLVRLQIAIAAGARLPFTQEQVQVRGHAIEVRLYAEDPVTFLPAVGRLALFEPPHGPGIRVDAGLATGDAVTVHYDPMIAKLIVGGADRPAAIDRLRRALDDLAVLGLTTNLPLLCAIAAHPAFRAGDTHTGFLGEHPMGVAAPADPPVEVLAAAAIVELGARGAGRGHREPASGGQAVEAQDIAPIPGQWPRRSPFAQLWRGAGLGLPLAFEAGGKLYRVRAQADGAGWRLTAGERTLRVERVAEGPGELVLQLVPAGDPAAPAPATSAALWKSVVQRPGNPLPVPDDGRRTTDDGHAIAPRSSVVGRRSSQPETNVGGAVVVGSDQGRRTDSAGDAGGSPGAHPPYLPPHPPTPEAFGRERFRLARDGAALLIAWRGGSYRVEKPRPLSSDSVTRAGGGHDGASLSAPMPGTLIKILVREGEEVAEGQPLLVLEAMKMEHTVVAPYPGTVRRLPFAQGASVSGGATLIDLVGR